MDIYVYSRDNERLDVIDTYESAIWDLRYCDVGKFELYIAASPRFVQLLTPGNRLVRDVDINNDGSMQHVMTIKKVVLSTSDEDGDYLIVTGFDLKSILGQRIVWNQTILSGSIEKCVEKLMNENVISPAAESRKIDRFVLDLQGRYDESMQKQITGDNLLDAVIDILSTHNAGWDIYIDSEHNYRMILLNGVNRSIDQDINSRVVFSAKNENIIDDTYTLDWTDYVNVVLVAGEGEGTARRRAVTGHAKGLDRYESFKDARDISSNNGEISDTAYSNMLKTAGAKLITESGYVEKYEGSIETRGLYEYGIDYGLGDVVTVINRYGISANPRITGVIESVDESGVTIVPTLSTWIGD